MTDIKDIVRNRPVQSGDIIHVNLASSLNTLKANYRGIMGEQYASNGSNAVVDRYGLSSGQNNIPGVLLLQATDWCKRVTVTGLLNGISVVGEANVWVRIYRELSYSWYMSSDGDKRYALPYKAASSSSGGGSHGFTAVAGGSPWHPVGSHHIMWISWLTPDDYGRGLLIDASKSASQTLPDTSDKNTFNGSFRSSGISNFHSNATTWDSVYGIKVHEEDQITYRMRDDPSMPVKKGSELLAEAPKVTISQTTVSGTNSLRLIEQRSTNAPGTDATNILSGSGTSTERFKWSHVDINVIGTWTPVAVSADDYERIRILKEKTQFAPQPATLGDSTLISSGASQNWVLPNILFEADPSRGAPSKWSPSLARVGGTEQYIKPVVVDGASLVAKTGNTGPYAPGLDSTWIGANTNPNQYWYVLPKVVRRLASGCCINKKPDELTATPALEFNSPGSLCTYGRHWGKFLKTEFTQSDLSGWLNFIESAAEKTAISVSISSGTSFVGYRRNGTTGSASPNFSGPTYVPFNFTLRGLPEFSGFTGVVSISPTPGGSPSDLPSPGAVEDTIDPRLLESINAAFSKRETNEWTVGSIAQFANNQANKLGVPLGEIKAELLKLLLDAKIRWFVLEQGMSITNATAKAESDPVYKSLVGLFASGGGSGSAGGGSGGGSGGRRGAGNGNGGGGQTKTIRITVTRGLSGYQTGIRQAMTNDKPELVQTYLYTEVENGIATTKTALRRFEFPFVPKQVNYSGLGVQWTEIERTGNFPVVDWTNFQLLKVSFNFDIVDRKLENQTGFGLYWSCEDQIRMLREMAQSPYPVTFLNMDQFMSEELRYPLFTRGRGIEFVIAEFSVASVQRTPANAPMLAENVIPNQISRATCSMTLQEIPIEAIDIVQMPPIKPCNKNRKKCDDIPTTDEDPNRTYLLFTGGMLRG